MTAATPSPVEPGTPSPVGPGTPLLGIVCGSPADRDHADAIADAARKLGIEVELRIASAHRTPEHALAVLRGWDAAAEHRPVVIVSVAGRSNALSGFSDPQVRVPVIACPPPGPDVDLWSSLRMPAGVASVVVLEPANAALAAAKMLGLADTKVRAAVAADQAARRQRVLDADADAVGPS